MSNFKFPDEKEEVEVPEVEVEIVNDELDEDKDQKIPEKEGVDPSDEELSSYSEKVQGLINNLDFYLSRLNLVVFVLFIGEFKLRHV